MTYLRFESHIMLIFDIGECVSYLSIPKFLAKNEFAFIICVCVL